jgi:hypothetical protein
LIIPFTLGGLVPKWAAISSKDGAMPCLSVNRCMKARYSPWRTVKEGVISWHQLVGPLDHHREDAEVMLVFVAPGLEYRDEN